MVEEMGNGYGYLDRQNESGFGSEHCVSPSVPALLLTPNTPLRTSPKALLLLVCHLSFSFFFALLPPPAVGDISDARSKYQTPFEMLITLYSSKQMSHD